MVVLLFVWIVGIRKLHLEKLVFNEARVYRRFPSMGPNGLDVALKLFHIFVVCCVPPLK